MSCPKCNCPRMTRLSRSSWWNQEMDKMQCEHCGHVWRQYAPLIEKPATNQVGPPVPTYRPLERPLCPVCGSKSKVTSSRGRIRYHQCKTCKHNFKTVRG